MKHKNSTQNLILKRLLSLCNEHTTSEGFTLDQIASWPPIRARNVKRDSINKALRRFCTLGIVLSLRVNQKNKPLFRIKNSEWAIAYIEGDKNKPWLPLTPTPSKDEFTDFDEHRDHFDITLTTAAFDVLRKYGTENHNQFTWRHKSFTISANGQSLKGQVYIKPYWRTDIKHYFGEEFYAYLADLDNRGARRGDLCLPIGMMGERISLGGRATQFSGSHFPAQLDVRARKDDKNLREGLNALVNQGDFNIRILDSLDAIVDGMKSIGEHNSRNTEVLEKLVKLLSPKADDEPKGDYQGKPMDKDDRMYG